MSEWVQREGELWQWVESGWLEDVDAGVGCLLGVEETGAGWVGGMEGVFAGADEADGCLMPVGPAIGALP
ncbi:hypothetical protein [Streptomyces olivochromogenes]|uniref:hypothetical protein n=1 Tax=Streptomyces olivochromogenes TaxID=1963 RepID=UPI001F412326|nr:hypothetical protein [Streptomyces olivochromogenes]